MTIPYLQGWGDTLSQTVPQIGAGIAHVLNPNLDQQLALKKAIATNPQLAQSLADLEHQAPGTLQRLGLGNVGDTISQIPMSFAKQQENDTRNAYETNPDLKTATINKKLIGQTPEEARRTTAEADLATAQAGEAVSRKREMDLDFDNKKRQMDEIDAAWKKVPDISKYNLADLATQYFKSGKFDDPALQQRIFADPVASDAFNRYIQVAKDRASLAAENKRTDIIANSSRGEQAVLLREAITNRKQADTRVQQLMNELPKYDLSKAGNNDSIFATAKDKDGQLLANQLDEHGQPKYPLNYAAQQRIQQAAASRQSILDEIDAAKKARDEADEMFQAVAKTNPSLAKLFKDDNTPAAKTNTTTTPAKAGQGTNTGTSNTGGKPSNIRQNYVNFAKQHIATDGLERVKKTAAWKAMTPEEQAAAQQP